MKTTRKVLVALLVLVAMMMSMTVIVAGAEEAAGTKYVFEATSLEAFGADEANDGTTATAGTDNYFTLMYNSKSKVDGSNKTWSDDYSSSQRLYLGGKTTTSSAAIKFTTSAAATVTVWWVSNDGTNDNAGSGARPVGVLDANGEIVAQDTSVVAKNATHISTFELSAAGTYYLGNMVDNNYFFKVEVVEKAAGEPETPHVNSLAVGDNKFVITDALITAQAEYFYLSVAEDSCYTLTAPDASNMAFFIYTDPIEEKEWALTNAFVTNYGSTNTSVKTNLKKGTYVVVINYAAMAAGEYNVNLTKSAYETPTHENALVLGDNKFVVTDTLLASYIEYITFVAETDGKYTFTASEDSKFVLFAYTDPWTEEWVYTDPYVTNNGSTNNFVSVNLKAGVYIVGVNYFYGGTTAGEYNINVTKDEYEEGGNDVVVKNTVALGENTYVLSESLKNLGYEFTTFTAAESGLYTFEGADPLTIFIWPDYPNVAVGDIPTTAPYIWNVKADNSGFEESVTVYLEAGVYAFGFRYDFVTEAGEYTYNISFEPHEHEFVEGKCECGANDPDYTPPVEETPDDPAEEPELNFFEKIWQAILDFFKSIGDFFTNLFGGKE
nr:hypothetical protein [Oscillospiraceae bacterium]